MTSLIRGFDQSLRNTIKSLGPKTIFVAKFSALSFSSGASFLELMRRPEPHRGRRRSDQAAGADRSRWSTSGSAPAGSRPWSASSIAANAPRRCRSWARPSTSSTSTSPRSSPAASFTEQEVQRRRNVAVHRLRAVRGAVREEGHRSDRQEGPPRRHRVHGHRRDRQAPGHWRLRSEPGRFRRSFPTRRTASSSAPSAIRTGPFGGRSAHDCRRAARVGDARGRRCARSRRSCASATA